MKKIVSVVLVITMLFSLAMTAFASDSTTAKSLRFNSDGNFRIMHVTDTHLSYDNVDESTYLLGVACDREKPDMIALTGDIAMADTLEEQFSNIDKLMSVFEERNIPVAIVFGNHDTENGTISREDLMAYYNKYSCSISVDDGDSLPGCGTYNVPVLASDSDNVKFNIWMFDSGSGYLDEGYTSVLPEQINWYVEKSNELKAANGNETVYSLAFQHIIVPEVYDALKKVSTPRAYAYKHMYDNTYYEFDSSVTNYGTLHETPCSGYFNYGQFDSMVQQGDVLGIFTGHDHTNAFGVRYKDIDIVNSLSTRYNGDMYSTQYGYRIIDINEDDTASYSTRVVRWYDFFTSDDVKALKTAGDDFGYNVAKEIRFIGGIEKFFENLGHIIVRIFAFRQVSYDD